MKEEELIGKMFHAVRNNDVEGARRLIDDGIDVNRKDRLTDITLLHLAADRGNTEVARLLIDKGAEVDARTVANGTPLQYAATRNHAKTASLLIERGADIDAKDRDGKTAIDLAIQHGAKDVVALIESIAPYRRFRNIVEDTSSRTKHDSIVVETSHKHGTITR